MQDVTHNAAAPALAAIPAARTKVPGRDQATKAQISWNMASAAKKTPDGNQSPQCIGVTAKWITAAPSEATAAQRAASRLSVFDASLVATSSTITQPPNQHEQQDIAVASQISNARMPTFGRMRRGGKPLLRFRRALKRADGEPGEY